MQEATTALVKPQDRDRILREKEVRDLTGLGKTKLHALITAGEFPRPVQLSSSRSVGYRESQVQDWIASLPDADLPERRERARKLVAARKRPAPANPVQEREIRAAAKENPEAAPPMRLSRRSRQLQGS